ncbi:histidine phosphatase family protein [Paenibacillus arenosi]|uniref:Histidine phosphatase family protein n=1 Tax=Paenibacillus arenosi TaxID=2774142 RepID=A0ABR9B033_9BACL|nr:histidine phosphatase family protein [Paenibacillus arenosi]MBD8498815.1 histidine phosphatase family protein [Paenibacillus arenosi]
MNNLFIIRHGYGAGEEASTPLTEEENEQAKQLASCMNELNVDVLISSPSLRTIHSLQPTAIQLRKPIVIDERMEEWLLAISHSAAGMKQLAQLFTHEACRSKEESIGRATLARGVSVLSNALNKQANNVAVMTSRHEISALLGYFDIEEDVRGENTSYMDIFVIRCKAEQLSLERVWSCGQALELLPT